MIRNGLNQISADFITSQISTNERLALQYYQDLMAW